MRNNGCGKTEVRSFIDVFAHFRLPRSFQLEIQARLRGAAVAGGTRVSGAQEQAALRLQVLREYVQARAAGRGRPAVGDS